MFFLAPGDYYLYASVGSSMFYVEWIVPIHIERDPVQVDLAGFDPLHPLSFGPGT
jgi:hypothetical protein